MRIWDETGRPLEEYAHIHHAAKARRMQAAFSNLTADEQVCVSATAESPDFNLTDCGSGMTFSIESIVARQLSNANGTVTSFQSMSLIAQISNGQPACGCPGITQVTNVPGQNASWNRPMALFAQPPIEMYSMKLLGFVPPMIAMANLGVCDNPINLVANLTANVSSAYLATVQAFYNSLSNDRRRRLRAKNYAQATMKPDGTHTHGRMAWAHPQEGVEDNAPLHASIDLPLMEYVKRALYAAKNAARIDALTDHRSRALRARGVRAMNFVDPEGGIHGVGCHEVRSLAKKLWAGDAPATPKCTNKIPVKELAEAVPYVDPRIWAESAALGNHTSMRVLFSLAKQMSNEMHAAEAGIDVEFESYVHATDASHNLRRLRETENIPRRRNLLHVSDRLRFDGSAKSFQDTLAETGDMSHASLLENTPRGHAARRHLQAGFVALAFAAVLEVQVVELGKTASDLSDAVSATQATLTGVQNEAGNLSTIATSLNNITSSQSLEIGSLNNLVQNDTRAVQKNAAQQAQTAATVSLMASKLAAFQQQTGQEMDNAASTFNAGLEAARQAEYSDETQVSRDIATLASTYLNTSQAQQAQIVSLGKSIMGAVHAMNLRSQVDGLAFNQGYLTLDVMTSRTSLHQSLFKSVYAALDLYGVSGWRPFWTAEAMSGANFPAPPQDTLPGSPLGRVNIDAMSVVRVFRKPGVPDGAANGEYNGTVNHYILHDTMVLACNAMVALDMMSATKTAIEILNTVGPAEGCVLPFGGNLTQWETLYGQGETYGGGGALCACWIEWKQDRCDTLLTDASAIPLTLNPAAVATETTGSLFTIAGLHGVTTSENVVINTPCVISSETGNVTVTQTVPLTILSTTANITAVWGELSCPTTGNLRNVSQGLADLASAGTPQALLDAKSLADTYVFSLTTGVNLGLEDRLFGVALPPNSATTTSPYYGTTSSCSGAPVDTQSYATATAAKQLAWFTQQSWIAAQPAVGLKRVALYGAPNNDISTTEVPFNYDAELHSSYLCITAQVPIVQDAQNGWVPVYLATMEGEYVEADVFMPGRAAIPDNANNDVPVYRSSTNLINTIMNMDDLLPAQFHIIGEPYCWYNNCTIPAMGSFYGSELGQGQYLYDVPESSMSFAADPSQNEHKVTYMMAKAQAGDVASNRSGPYPMTDPAVATNRTLTDWNRDWGEGNWVPTAATASIASYIRTIMPGTTLNPYAVTCNTPEQAEDGVRCLVFDYFSGYQYTEADTRLAGKQPSRCQVSAPFNPNELLCFTPLSATLQVMNLLVPGGQITQTLGNTCPFVDTAIASMGGNVVTLTVPPTTAAPTEVWYTFSCPGLGDQTTAVNAAAMLTTCNLYRYGNVSQTGPKMVGAGSTLEVAFPDFVSDSGIKVWNLTLYTMDPSTGLTVSCRNTSVSVNPVGTNAIPYGRANVTIAPQFVDDAGIAALNSFNQGTSAAAQMMGDALVMLDTKINAISAASGTSQLWEAAIANISAQANAAGNTSLAWQQYEESLSTFKSQVSNNTNSSVDALNQLSQTFAQQASAVLNNTAALAADLAETQQVYSQAQASIANQETIIASATTQYDAARTEVEQGLANITRYLNAANSELSSFNDLNPLSLAGDLAKTLGSLGGMLGSIFSVLLGSLLPILLIVFVLYCVWKAL